MDTSTKIYKNPMDSSEKLYLDSEPKPNLKSGKLRFAPAVLFVAFIFGLSIWFVVNPKADYSSSEKRYLQQFPETSVDTVLSGEFSEKFETYFADHFPQRNMWVGLNSYYNLGIGLNGRNGVYNSADGYLINVPVDKENYVRKNIRVLAEFKEKIGDVPMTVMLAPSTGYIATDKLPLIHDSYNDDTYFAETAKTLGESGVNFVDLRETFKQKYAEGVQLYYRTDHHWTTDGAYEGYVKLCEKLGVQPADKDSFAKTAYGGFYGTTYSTSGYWLTKPDSITVYDNQENTDKNITVKISEDGKDNHYGSMFFYNHIDEDDKYPVFLDGNHALTEIQNKNAKNGTIVVIKDSFSHSLAPFLAENYSKVVLVDLRYYKQSVSDLIKKENPEQVVALYGIDNLATDTDIVWLQ
ncbi:MAG: DHHW family protein [Ruminococcus sp.]|nr:DHHW family protein [Ruminococcus sp.]